MIPIQTISLLVPIYNEELNLKHFFEQVISLFNQLEEDYEIICVNDGSTDKSLEILIQVNTTNPKIKVISFSRNFGKEAALSAALDHAKGDALIPIDCDLQDPIDLIPQMIDKWKNDHYQVVCARRISRSSDSWLKKTSAKYFYRFFNQLSDVPIPENVGDFRLMDKSVAEIVKQLPEKNRFMKGLFSWVGFHTSYIDYEREERWAGKSKFNYWKLWNFAIDGFTSFSSIPIRLSTYLGAIISLGAFSYAFYIILKTLIYGKDTPGYASLIVVILLQFGIQMIAIGILGEYIGRIFQEVKNRPLYVVAYTRGIDEKDD